MKFMATRPEHDITTYYLSSFCSAMIDFAQSRGWSILDLHREKSAKEEVESGLTKFSPGLVVFNGHGDEKTITGHKNIDIVRFGDNEHLLAAKVIYAISCRSAKTLGPAAVGCGAISYLGFDDDFIFLYDSRHKPEIDPTAKMFLEPSTRLVQSLVKGNTVAESCERALSLLRENMLKSLPNDPSAAKYLWWDMRHFVAHGSMNAKVPA
ncbi:MAG: hypothetical protein ABIF10_05980 [Candidatus Woesearchaeota archaeon]